MSCKSVLIERFSFPYAVHSPWQQMGVLQVTVHSLCLLQLWFQTSSLWCLHSWFSCCCVDIAAASFLFVHHPNICKCAVYHRAIISDKVFHFVCSNVLFIEGLWSVVLYWQGGNDVSRSLTILLHSFSFLIHYIFYTPQFHILWIKELLLSGAIYNQRKIRTHFSSYITKNCTQHIRKQHKSSEPEKSTSPS